MASPLRIDLDGSSWTNVLDFHTAVLKAVQAPDWHGYSLDALNDSMVWGGINGLEPPYELVVHNLISPEIAAYVDEAREVLASGRAEHRTRYGHDVEVSIRRAEQPPSA